MNVLELLVLLLVAGLCGASFPIVWSILGAAIFVALLGVLQRR